MNLSEPFLHRGFGRRWEGILGSGGRVLLRGRGSPEEGGQK